MNNIIDRVTKMENILEELTMVVEKSDKALNELLESLKNLMYIRFSSYCCNTCYH